MAGALNKALSPSFSFPVIPKTPHPSRACYVIAARRLASPSSSEQAAIRLCLLFRGSLWPFESNLIRSKA
ncbi:hypothetical protein AVEN_101521-1, partial [Araneus ventricosus]